MNSTPDSRIDRLYDLLPDIYRMRDAEQGYPLQALLRVIAEQVNAVEDNISQLYENWFIETAEDWAVPYIADLIGYRPVTDPGEAGTETTQEGQQLYRALIPRREVANTLRYRRRKGTLALLELLANDIADWSARAVEFFQLLGWNQNINHQHMHRARTVDVRRLEELDVLDGPFNRTAHTVDVRRIDSTLTTGRYNIPSVGVFVWRLKSYPVTYSPAHRPEHAPPHCGMFSVLGQDTQLYIKPKRESDPSHIAEELNLPAPIRPLAFKRHKELYYGEDKSFAIWAEGWGDVAPTVPVPIDRIDYADLSNWQFIPRIDHIAVDPVLGRFAFNPDQLPEKAVRVSYHYAFSADIGGGEYPRLTTDPSPRPERIPHHQASSNDIPMPTKVGKGQHIRRLSDALDALLQWQQEKSLDAIIELTDSSVYVIDPIRIDLKQNHTLQIRAANGVRPVIRLRRQEDWQNDFEGNVSLLETLTVIMEPGSRFILDGLMITGWTLHIDGMKPEHSKETNYHDRSLSSVLIRHCTFVPDWDIECNCEPQNGEEPSLRFHHLQAKVRIEHSIIGPLQIHEDEVHTDPITITIVDSVLDAINAEKEAIGAEDLGIAHARLTMLRSTVFGIINVHAIDLAENCIFNDCVHVARRQLGCMRFCYVPLKCRTPRRYNCQPDLAVKAIEDKAIKENIPAPLRDSAIASEHLRLQPQFTSRHYGNPAYAQLALACAQEIKCGADDESELGVFHDLFQPQREANLRTRLKEYTPAGMNIGLIFAT